MRLKKFGGQERKNADKQRKAVSPKIKNLQNKLRNQLTHLTDDQIRKIIPTLKGNLSPDDEVIVERITNEDYKNQILTENAVDQFRDARQQTKSRTAGAASKWKVNAAKSNLLQQQALDQFVKNEEAKRKQAGEDEEKSNFLHQQAVDKFNKNATIFKQKAAAQKQKTEQLNVFQQAGKDAAEQAKQLKQQQDAEQQRLAEQVKQLKQQQEVEQQRLAEQTKQLKQRQEVEQQRLAEQAKQLKQQQEVEQQRLAEQEMEATHKKQQEAILKQQQLAEQQRLAEQIFKAQHEVEKVNLPLPLKHKSSRTLKSRISQVIRDIKSLHGF